MRVLLSHGAWYLCLKNSRFDAHRLDEENCCRRLSDDRHSICVNASPSAIPLSSLWRETQQRCRVHTRKSLQLQRVFAFRSQYSAKAAKWSANAMGIQSAMTKLEQTLAGWMRRSRRRRRYCSRSNVSNRFKNEIMYFVCMVNGDFICKIENASQIGRERTENQKPTDDTKTKAHQQHTHTHTK